MSLSAVCQTDIYRELRKEKSEPHLITVVLQPYFMSEKERRDYSMIENDVRHMSRPTVNVFRAFVEFAVFGIIILLIVLIATNSTMLSDFFTKPEKGTTCIYEDVYNAVSTGNKVKISEYSQDNIELTGRFIRTKGNYMYLGPVGGGSTTNYIKCYIGDKNKPLSSEVQNYGLGSKVKVKGKFKSLKKNQMTFRITEFVT